MGTALQHFLPIGHIPTYLHFGRPGPYAVAGNQGKQSDNQARGSMLCQWIHAPTDLRVFIKIWALAQSLGEKSKLFRM